MFSPSLAEEKEEGKFTNSQIISKTNLDTAEKLFYYEQTLSLISELNNEVSSKEAQKRAQQIDKAFESFNKFKFNILNKTTRNEALAEWGTFTSILPYLVKNSTEGLLRSLEKTRYAKNKSFFPKRGKKDSYQVIGLSDLQESLDKIKNTLETKTFGKSVTKTNVPLNTIYRLVQDFRDKFHTYQHAYREEKHKKQLSLLYYFCCPLGTWFPLD